MEFLVLLIVTLIIAAVVATIVVFSFKKPIDRIFARIIGEDISGEWRKFLTFALFVVGISAGVNVWKLERFLPQSGESMVQVELSSEYFALEIYRTIISTLGGMAWALLVFFVVALIAFVMVKRGERQRTA